MKKLVIALALGMFSLPILAQEHARNHDEVVSPEARSKQMVEKMTKHLNLSEEQAKALQPLLLDFHKNESQSREDRRKRLEALKADLAEILDEEQMKKFESKMKHRRKRMHKSRKHQEAEREAPEVEEE
ncbi:MAG: hypothetical protein NXI09_02680 [Bacteroidetes bacterium]|nr:hypothetical protein [Bacteroidota bacterium]